MGRYVLSGWEEITIGGVVYPHDVLVARGVVAKRTKEPSKPLKEKYGGHTPLSAAETIPWGGRLLVVGTGHDGRLPVDGGVVAEAARRGVELRIMTKAEACALLSGLPEEEQYAVLHTTC